MDLLGWGLLNLNERKPKVGHRCLFPRSLLLALIFNFLALLVGCSQSDSIIKECILPEDQAGTLAGRWQVKPPVPFGLKAGDWNPSEMEAFNKAIKTWNSFYNASQGFSLIEERGEVNQAESFALCTGNITSSGSFSGVVTAFKKTTFSNPEAIAITAYCFNTASPLNQIYNATLKVNYQNYFVSGQKQPDLQSIVLHELGHLIGLNHSCDGSGTPGIPDCSNPELNSDYFFASMFPTVNFNGLQGEQRRTLKTNDQGRANCLYDEEFSGPNS